MPSLFHSPTAKIFGRAFLDTLFPISCLGCDTPGNYLCAVCFSVFPRRIRQRCPTCLRKTTPRGETCFECAHLRSLNGLFAASTYRAPLVSLSIHTFKYKFISSLAQPLGQWLAERITEMELPLPDLFVPVPLHPRRLRFRGFNQSLLIAQILVDTLVPGFGSDVLQDCLIRTRYTKPQMTTEAKEERLKNLDNAFSMNKKSAPSIKGKSVWLIDDVSTTGTTLEECARVLKRAGAKSVFGIVLAR